jgi:hypothetical protein
MVSQTEDFTSSRIFGPKTVCRAAAGWAWAKRPRPRMRLAVIMRRKRQSDWHDYPTLEPSAEDDWTRKSIGRAREVECDQHHSGCGKFCHCLG